MSTIAAAAVTEPTNATTTPTMKRELRSSSKLADPKTETKADTNECASQDVEAIDSSKEEPHAQTTEAEADANKVETTTEASDSVPEPVQAKQTVQGEEADAPQPSPAGPDGVSKDEEAHDKDDAAVGDKRPNNGLGETASSTEKLKKSKSTAGSDEKKEEAQAENVGGN